MGGAIYDKVVPMKNDYVMTVAHRMDQGAIKGRGRRLSSSNTG